VLGRDALPRLASRFLTRCRVCLLRAQFECIWKEHQLTKKHRWLLTDMVRLICTPLADQHLSSIAVLA
jgi:hypothetical protein